MLAYHDVEDDAADQRYLSVRTSALNEQIAWLLHNGYHAISVQDILDAHYGLKSLPPKAFLLSFDDGYSSFYTRVWPLLKARNVPALWAPVGSWVDTPAGQPVNFGGLMTPRERFATREMVRELSRSPLVEIGAHTGPRTTVCRPIRRAAASLPPPTAAGIKPPAAMKATRSLPGE